MLSDEERKAIEILKDLKKTFGIRRNYMITYTLKSGIEYKQDELVNGLEYILNLINKYEKAIQKAIDFIDDDYTYFVDGENWQNVLKIKEILEGKDDNR